MARLLLCLAGPAHVVFLLITKWISPDFYLTPLFVFCYLSISILQVAAVLQLCDNFVHWLWSLGVDPDNTAIPFLTAIADLFGSVLLALTFVLLYQVSDPNAINSPDPVVASYSVPDISTDLLSEIYNQSARAD